MLAKIIVLLVAITASVAVSTGGRPCRLKDIACIKRNLAINSRCNPVVRGRIPSRYTIQRFPFHTPFFNATYVDNNLIVTNHDKCIVSEYNHNYQTQTAVLSIDCAMMGFESNRTLIQHASLREDTYFSYAIKGTYPLIRLTTNLKYNRGLNLCNTFTFADVVALPIFNINPNNQQTANFLSRDLSVLNIYERECFFWRAPFLARYFINSILCDFGCNS